MSEQAPCGICGRVFHRSNCHIIELTDEEREILTKQRGEAPPDEFIYCNPCWATLSDPTTGPAYGKGLLQQGLQRFGVGNAEEIASKFHAKLVDKINKPKPT